MRVRLWLLVLLGCGAQPTTVDGCIALAEGPDRDECLLTLLPALFKTDPARGIEVTEQYVSDPTTRDFVWLTITRDVDPNSRKYCDRIVDTLLKERCEVLVSRPHLHRELMGGQPGPGMGLPGGRGPGGQGGPGMGGPGMGGGQGGPGGIGTPAAGGPPPAPAAPATP